MKLDKQIKVDIPDGYIIDEEKSSLKEGNIIFKKKEILLPKSWEEVEKTLHVNYRFALEQLYLIANKYYDLEKLKIIRDVYRQGWKPDWEENSLKYVLYHIGNQIDSRTAISAFYFLSFQSEEIRDEFLKNFKDLIEECKDFI